jgi:hypothetical protein
MARFEDPEFVSQKLSEISIRSFAGRYGVYIVYEPTQKRFAGQSQASSINGKKSDV